ncbi:MAG TPA: Do family serine endopeptidase [Steroidobacteraceae bacterium]|nr:Do family serine endopeptidase [Steroidobacteraceae bacterium]
MQLRKTTAILSASGLLAFGAATGWIAPMALHANGATAAEATASGVTAAPAPAPVAYGTAPNYRAIVAQNRAAVVNVKTEGVEHTSAQEFGSPGDSPFGNDPFSQFFRGLPIPRGDVPVRGLGSGFIIKPDGIILTNAHVVRDAKHVTVTLADHREFRAKVLGSDPTSDIAVLKIEAHNLPVVHFGDPGELAVGDYVLAIGAPYGLEESATAGIVSAKGRSLPGGNYVPFIQTDVAVNPGNSGGPLFDSHGSVVGITSQIYSNTGGYQGVSFAIPIDVAERVESQILKTGKVEHARLGVIVQPVTPALAASFKLNSAAGALISRVDPDSAAARAGLQPGDVIVKFQGHDVSDAASLSAQVGMASPGDAVTLQVWHDGKTRDVKATLANASKEDGELASTSGGPDQGKLGLSVRPLTRDERSQAGVSNGLVVEQAAGAAAEAGIEPGDVLLSADGKALENVEQLRSIVREHKDVVALLIQRGDTRIFVPVQLG